MKLKSLLALCLVAAAPLLCASAAPASTVTGEVLEVKDVEVYTYIRLKTSTGETWAAVNKAPVKKGDKVTLNNVSTMENFESKALKKTFPSILFGNLAGAGQTTTDPHAGVAKTADLTVTNIAKATGTNAYTVAEVISRADKLKDKPVRIKGKVVKYNSGIMGKNWLHLRDGSGKAEDNTHDILVTTDASVKLGDVVTVAGVVHTNKDLGAGYSYKVLIEDATVKP